MTRWPTTEELPLTGNGEARRMLRQMALLWRTQCEKELEERLSKMKSAFRRAKNEISKWFKHYRQHPTLRCPLSDNLGVSSPWLVATFVKYVFRTYCNNQEVRRLSAPQKRIFTRAAGKPAQKRRVALSQKIFGSSVPTYYDRPHSIAQAK